MKTTTFRTTFRKAIAPGAAVVALSLVLAGCGSDDTSTPDAASGLTGALAGGGATSQEKAQDAWKAGFGEANPDVTISYDLVGSGTGRTNFIGGGTVFAGSDSYLNDDEGELTGAKERCAGTDPIEVPAYVSPIAVAFNLPGIESLNLDADTIADIFTGKITTWNDPAIAAFNDGVDLPDLAITAVHRSDDSGTTKNFTDYLGKASSSWNYEADDAFPINKGLAAEGTSGVVDAITNAEGAIGYADHSQTEGLGAVSVKVGDEFVAPSAEGAAKAVAVSPVVEGRPAVDMAVDIDRTTTESGAYPVVLLSYLIACQTYDDAATAELVNAYLSYVLSDEGQSYAAQYAGSAPLTSDVAAKAQEIVGKIAAS